MDVSGMCALALACGATNAVPVGQADIALSASFRDLCAANACGFYGKCYMCPPDVGDIHALMARVRAYGDGAMYQTIGVLEDSYDIEGMTAAGKRHIEVSLALEDALRARGENDRLHLSAGGCRLCDVCAKNDNMPCRFPGRALAGLESHGVDVYNTARNVGLRYVNGQNTVTYFGMVLLGGG